MKGLLIAIVTSAILFTGLAHAKPNHASSLNQGSFCQKNPKICSRAAAWCAHHVGSRRACKVSQDVYCRHHKVKCETGI